MRNLYFCLTSSFSKTSENHLLFVMKINFVGTASPISRSRLPVVNLFILFPGSWLMKWKHKCEISIGMSNKDIFFLRTNSALILSYWFFCFVSIIRTSFEHFSDRGIPHFLVDMIPRIILVTSVLKQTANSVPAIVLDIPYLAAADYIKAKEKAKQSKTKNKIKQ